MSEPQYGTFHNVLTGEITVRELTDEEVLELQSLPEPLG